MNSGKRRTNEPHDSSITQEMMMAVMELTRRYRLVIFPAVAELSVFQGRGPKIVRRVLRARVEREWLSTAWLHVGARYWYLGPAAALDPSDRKCTEFSEPAKLRAVGLLRYCCLSGQRKHLLTPDELQRGFPAVARPGLPRGYYFDPANAGRLGFARIDALQNARWDRSIAVIRQDLTDHWLRAGFRQLLEADRFELAYITALPEKAHRLRTALRGDSLAQRTRLHVVAIPELLSLCGNDRQGGRRLSHLATKRARRRGRQ